MNYLLRIAGSIALLTTAASPARGDSPAADSAPALRLLKTKCFSCHNEQKKKGGLVMSSRQALLQGGENGPALVSGSPADSAMIAALAVDADPHMPPKKQLSSAQIDVLTEWVKAGAPWMKSALIEPPRVVKLGPLPPAYHPILALALSPDSKRLAVGCGNELVIYEVVEKGLTMIARAHLHFDPIQSIAWSPDGMRVATGAFRRVIIWESASLEPDRHMTAGLTDRITAMRFTPGGDQLIIADGRVAEDGTIRIAEVASGGIGTSWLAHGDTIFDLSLSKDGQFLATASGDKLVKIWDLATLREVARIEAHAAQILTLAFNTDATQLVTGSADQQLKVWDVKSRDQIMILGRHSAGINALAWAAAGPALFAATDAGGVMRYTDFKAHSGAQSSDSASERKLEAAGTALHCLAVTPNGERVFAGSHDGRVLGWNKDGKLISKVEVNEPKATATASK